ncbi:hypothetical protein [Paraburkholderia sp. BL27I4N3]|nr:hypothetical protein [Paraburkholderia sp. BL27I4N3]
MPAFSLAGYHGPPVLVHLQQQVIDTLAQLAILRTEPRDNYPVDRTR